MSLENIISKISKKKMESNFQKQYSLKKRISESTRILIKYPNRIPIICERYGSSNIPNIDSNKYLVPLDLTVGKFLYVIRKRIKLSPESSIFIYVNNYLPATSKLIKDLYTTECNEDGFLYILYSSENTFG